MGREDERGEGFWGRGVGDEGFWEGEDEGCGAILNGGKGRKVFSPRLAEGMARFL